MTASKEANESKVDSSALIHITLILTMKLCCQAVEAYMSRLDPDKFKLTNGSCELAHSEVAENETHGTEYWAYLLPVLGGLLSTVCMNYITVMQLGGFAFLLTSVLVAVASSLGWLCSNPIPSHALWLLPTLSAGIAEPAIFYGIFRWHGRCPRVRTIVCALLYLCDKFGEHLGTLPWSNIIGSGHIMFAIAVSTLYIILSISLQEYSNESPTRLPTRKRMVRYAQIFSALTPFTVVLADYHWNIYAKELKVLGDIELTEDWSLSLRSPIIFGLVGCFASVIVTIYLSCLCSLPIQARIFAGIVLELLCSTFLALFTTAAPVFFANIGSSLLNVWLVVSLCEGVACCLVTVAYYEFLDSITSQQCKPFVIGILLTIRGVGGSISMAFSLAFNKILTSNNPIDKPNTGKTPFFFMYHLISVVLLSISLIYHKFWSLQCCEVLRVETEEAD